jgi:hypothetical protein
MNQKATPVRAWMNGFRFRVSLHRKSETLARKKPPLSLDIARDMVSEVEP